MLTISFCYSALYVLQFHNVYDGLTYHPQDAKKGMDLSTEQSMQTLALHQSLIMNHYVSMHKPRDYYLQAEADKLDRSYGCLPGELLEDTYLPQFIQEGAHTLKQYGCEQDLAAEM